MRKISIGSLFKKSESDTGKSKKKIMIIILIVIIAGIIYLAYPLILPDTSVKSPVTTTETVTTSVSTVTTVKTEAIPEVKEKTEFEIEMEKRKQGYEDKIFVYKPYEPPSNRNPFQKLSNITFAEQAVEEEGNVLRFPSPELPPGTKLTGIIDSRNNRVAIILMNEETYIANLYDIISERYIVKEIKKDEVIIDFNGYLFSLKIGGEEVSNGL
jgi:type II secretory pathway component PulC